MKKAGIAFLGMGKVGEGALGLLQEKRRKIRDERGVDLELRKVLVRDLGKRRPAGIDPAVLVDDLERVLADPGVDIVVEMMGGSGAAADAMVRALRAGKAVASANKDAMALRGAEIFTAARESGSRIRFEASVCAGLPLLKAMGEGLAANSVRRVRGILNGTTNYILSEMSASGASYGAALEAAMERGYAEPDPSSDVEGRDAAYKISILASLASGRQHDPAAALRRGIASIGKEDIERAREAGYAVKLVAEAEIGAEGSSLRVEPMLVPLGSQLASVSGSLNAVLLDCDAAGEIYISGRGAGPLPTASALLADVVDLALGAPAFPLPAGTAKASPSAWAGEHYLRVEAEDRPGLLGAVAQALGARGVGVAHIAQVLLGVGRAEIAIFTHEAPRKAAMLAAADIDALEPAGCAKVATVLPLCAVSQAR